MIIEAPHEHDVVELLPGLDPLELQERILSLSRSNDIGHRSLAFYLHDMQERSVHTVFGYSSVIEFAIDRLDMKKSKAYELVRAGRLLCEFQEIDQAFWDGDLSWSKVRLILRVVERDTEKAWIAKAKDSTSRELWFAVRYSDLGEAPREKLAGLPDPWPLVRGELDPAAYELWQTVRRIFEEERGEGVTDGEMCSLLAQAYLQGKAEVGKGGTPYQVVVDQCPNCKDAHLHTEEGRVPIDRETAERVARDAEVLDLSVEAQPRRQLDRPTTPNERKRVLARDGNRCRKCGGKKGVQVHHIEYRSKGGDTVQENLISLCAVCHGILHQDRFQIRGDAETPVFIGYQGRRISGRLEVRHARPDSARVESSSPSHTGTG